jgi:hypothetical protein
MTCCICLESPSRKDPTYLLACGCSQSWFHATCEGSWLNSLHLYEKTYCPTCRREVPFQTIYSFARESGPEQRLLQNMGIVFLIETALYASKGLYHSPLTLVFVWGIPFIIRSKYDIHYYMSYTASKVICDYILFIHSMYENNIEIFTSRCIQINICYMIFMLIHALAMNRSIKQRCNLLESYIISRSILHSKLLYLKSREATEIKMGDKDIYIYSLPSSLRPLP